MCNLVFEIPHAFAFMMKAYLYLADLCGCGVRDHVHALECFVPECRCEAGMR